MGIPTAIGCLHLTRLGVRRIPMKCVLCRVRCEREFVGGSAAKQSFRTGGGCRYCLRYGDRRFDYSDTMRHNAAH